MHSNFRGEVMYQAETDGNYWPPFLRDIPG